MRSWRISILAWLIGCGAAWGQGDYQAFVDEIKNRLDHTTRLYADGDSAGAREMVQSAYFEVFENLEGPIRINISAKQSYAMEAMFGEIRRLIGAGVKLEVVQGKTDWLKAQLDAALPVLRDGHQLRAESRDVTVAADGDIIEAWRECLRGLENDLAAAVTAYQDGEFKAARLKIERTWFANFKNSELEISVRLHRSRAAAAEINQRFSRLLKLAADGDAGITTVGYEITRLLDDLAELLPGLPAAREEVTVSDADAGAASSADWRAVGAQLNAAFAGAIEQYQRGDAKGAAAAVQDAYFDLFEASGMESKIGARDAAFKTRLENYFTRTVALMKAGRPAAELREQAAALSADLAAAAALLGGRGAGGAAGMFIYSLTIILREGLEALLIIAAIVAYLVKNGHTAKLALVRNAVLWALALSVATALGFHLLFVNAGQYREVFEGVTMLVAVTVLFSMSYWLLSKVEARRWRAYLEKKVSLALTKGSLAGLWLTCFLAVYREGAETVLFYYALAGDARGAADYGYLAAGLATGGAALAAVYFIMRLTVTRLPLKPFFLCTGGFMYAMALVYAGKGVRELIEGKVFQPTAAPFAPEVDWLGLYPYWETLTPQLILILAALVALWHLCRGAAAIKTNQKIEIKHT
ncbi:MAG: FTR1 family iron permease [Verrucomicrobiales bacterium]|jgi:high-affinity iron transporter|nr:FTR1 family iron permease [Verrucomicrobiales bacterium]